MWVISPRIIVCITLAKLIHPWIVRILGYAMDRMIPLSRARILSCTLERMIHPLISRILIYTVPDWYPSQMLFSVLYHSQIDIPLNSWYTGLYYGHIDTSLNSSVQWRNVSPASWYLVYWSILWQVCYPPFIARVHGYRVRARTRETCAKNWFWSYEIDLTEACAGGCQLQLVCISSCV
jgi:hypothetical protein